MVDVITPYTGLIVPYVRPVNGNVETLPPPPPIDPETSVAETKSELPTIPSSEKVSAASSINAATR